MRLAGKKAYTHANVPVCSPWPAIEVCVANGSQNQALQKGGAVFVTEDASLVASVCVRLRLCLRLRLRLRFCGSFLYQEWNLYASGANRDSVQFSS